MAGRRPRAVVLALQLLILAGAVLHIAVVNYVADDGFISFRYAEHLAHGDGVVYNLGERVEGYTNFLWVLLLAAVKWIAPQVAMATVARVAGTAATLATILIAFRLSTVVSQGPALGLLTGAFIAANSSVAAWAPAGLETSVFTMLVFAAAVTFVGRGRSAGALVRTGILLGLASMARPDGTFFFGLTLMALVAGERPRTLSRADAGPVLAKAAQLTLAFASIFVPYFLWRYHYYGDLFPNTAYAKVGMGLSQLSRGVLYVWRYALQYGVLLWILPVLLYLWRSRERWAWYFVWLIAAYVAYVVYVGGDGLAFHRFIAHVVPLISAIVAAALIDGHRRYLAPHALVSAPTAAAAVTLGCLLIFTASTTMVPVFFGNRARWFEPQSEIWFPGNGQDHDYVWFDNYFVDRLTIASRYLEQHTPPGAVVASTPAGAIAYFMERPVIDMLGLTDKHIARTVDSGPYHRAGHEKGDGAYVLSLAPDYILMGNVAVLPFPLTPESMPAKLVLKSEHELWANPDFHRRYELVTVRLSQEGLFQYFSYYHKRSP